MISHQFDVVAVLCVRNEAATLPHSLRHLVRSGIPFAIIDHESSDLTSDIVLSDEFRPWLVSFETLPYRGWFDLAEQLACKDALIRKIDANWVIHLDADEVLQSRASGEGLREAIARADGAGYNVINFEEFVFLPIDAEFDSGTLDFQPMVFYYFFEPSPQRLMRAWKRSLALSGQESGGHRLSGDGIRIFPENMILRHYIFRDQQHAFDKYTTRVFSDSDLVRGWHFNRLNQPRERFKFPAPHELERLSSPNSVEFSRRNPKRAHYWQW